MRQIQNLWNVCGIFTVDLSYKKFQCIWSVLLMATCVYNFSVATQILCKMDQWCTIFSTPMVAMYDWVLACTTLLSRITIMVQSKRNFVKYKATVKAFEVYSPTSPAQLKNYELFSLSVVLLCLTVILPANVTRLYYLYYYETRKDRALVIYYIFLYMQNLSMCCVETQFVSQCFAVYTKFREINGDLKELKDENNVGRGKYPFTMAVVSETPPRAKVVGKGVACTSLQGHVCGYDMGFYKSWFNGHPMANAVELLRIRHWLIRHAVETLNGFFGIHMGLSVFVLCVMALLDIYYEIFHDSPSKLLVFGWLLQYSLRIFMIILVAHCTTKQAMKTKSLIALTDNQTLDNNTKEELRLFLNQIDSSSIEFTVYDFFTLNTQVIKSAIAAGTTYLVILMELHTYNKQ
ncbi:7TM chemoreceptor [Cinara cedri]|uniref:Gustatory receptor n=1 Tax=Cinara cedri TaxID=506608 RepID=A0A5E4MIY6_9HEMI|nr:7TM chemoreceptor [Cinara cedri]